MLEPLSLTAILPTYNERDNIPILIEGILAAVQTPVQVLVVDDNSPDGTWQVVQEIAAREPRVRLLRRTTERGLTSAIWAGIRAADTDAVSWMDCDLAMPPETIPLLLERLNAGADIAIGSRYVPGGSDPGHSLMARAFSVVINTFASLLLGWGVRDYTSGFVAARRQVFDVPPAVGMSLSNRQGAARSFCKGITASTASTCWPAPSGWDTASPRCPTPAAPVSAANRRPERTCGTTCGAGGSMW